MGNREDLLAGAKRCLYDKGYVRTTVRDIASAGGVSMAAIGYHFGSKEALLNAALIAANEEWGEELGRALSAEVAPGTPPVERFETIWDRVIALFDTNRKLWVTTFEVVALYDHVPQVRELFDSVIQEASEGLAELFLGTESTMDAAAKRAAGSFLQALLTGVMARWLIDPEHAPRGADLADGLRALAREIG
jgi:AcrR family transcriptional regulator